MVFILLLFFLCSGYALQATSSDKVSLQEIDDLEIMATDNNVFDTLEVKPPSEFMIKLRRIFGGSFLDFIIATQIKISNGWQWLKALFVVSQKYSHNNQIPVSDAHE